MIRANIPAHHSAPVPPSILPSSLFPPLLSGCCYAFAAAAAIESLVAIKRGASYLYNFAPQQIMDCSSAYGNQGCNGGLASAAFSYVIKSGLTYETYYPYKAVQQSCRVSSVSEGGRRGRRGLLWLVIPATDCSCRRRCVRVQVKHVDATPCII